MQNPSANPHSEDYSTDNGGYRSWAERNGFADWALALLWIIAAFFLFQFTGFTVAIVLIGMREPISSNPAELMDQMMNHPDLLLVGNSTGQILFLGLATWFWTRLHTSKQERSSFLQFTFDRNTLQYIGLGIVLILAVQPVIWFLSWLNALIPVPESMTQMQNTQLEMIESYIRSDDMLLIMLFNMALVPAFCEEVLYRGYVMSSFKKSWGVWPAIFISGFLFGLYHLQLSNLIPLATLGILFAYITWVSKSIYPAMVAHFVNNGGSVLMGKYYPESAFAELTPESMPPLWAVILSLLIAGYIVYWMYNQHTKSSD
jgi:membrane protease YdiL (CAAX protease family)